MVMPIITAFIVLISGLFTLQTQTKTNQFIKQNQDRKDSQVGFYGTEVVALHKYALWRENSIPVTVPFSWRSRAENYYHTCQAAQYPTAESIKEQIQSDFLDLTTCRKMPTFLKALCKFWVAEYYPISSQDAPPGGTTPGLRDIAITNSAYGYGNQATGLVSNYNSGTGIGSPVNLAGTMSVPSSLLTSRLKRFNGGNLSLSLRTLNSSNSDIYQNICGNMDLPKNDLRTCLSLPTTVPPTTINVEALSDTAGFGVAGAVVPAIPGDLMIVFLGGGATTSSRYGNKTTSASLTTCIPVPRYKTGFKYSISPTDPATVLGDYQFLINDCNKPFQVEDCYYYKTPGPSTTGPCRFYPTDPTYQNYLTITYKGTPGLCDPVNTPLSNYALDHTNIASGKITGLKEGETIIIEAWGTTGTVPLETKILTATANTSLNWSFNHGLVVDINSIRIYTRLWTPPPTAQWVQDSMRVYY